MKKKRLLSIAVIIAWAFPCLINDSIITFAQQDSNQNVSEKISSYTQYIEEYKTAGRPESEIIIQGLEYVNADNNTKNIEINEKKAVNTSSDGFIEWKTTIPQSGMYNIQLTYCNVEGKGSAIERELQIDGKVPFSEARFLTFSRSFQDVQKEYVTDSAENQIRPQQQEVFRVRNVDFKDPMGYVAAPLLFYLEKGEHTIKLVSVREPMAILQIKLYQADKSLSYQQYDAKYPKEKGQDKIFIEAEKIKEKSDFSIYPYNDRSSAFTTPQDAYKIKLNAIGGNKWQSSGQWISWTFPVEKAGRYQIVLRSRQNIRNGTYVTRKILIDDQIPFAEAKNVRFEYTSGWKTEGIGQNGSPFEFYLSEGQHTLTMEVSLGELAEILGAADESLLALNNIYRNILMITGPTPDVYRDYEFASTIPDTIAEIKKQATILRKLSKQLEETTHTKGEDTAIIDKLAFQLDTMAKKPENIAKIFTSFESNISAFGTWVLTARQQPLELDSIQVIPASDMVSVTDKGFFKQLKFAVETFISSFIVDYNEIGDVGKEGKGSGIEVWLATGRDQAQIIKSLSEDSFNTEEGIKVNVKLVGAGTLLPSVLAGIGPDVSLFNTCTDPVNYATRKAVVDLSKFDDYKEVTERFIPASLTPYQYQNGTYALPETVIFPMMFYRKDIFNQLGLTPPKTWDDFYKLIPEIQKRNMQIGFPMTLSGLQIFLYQNSGSLYDENYTKSSFDQDKTLDAFDRLTDLFNVYRFPAQFDFANRFRTGEMPLAIMDYTMYNQLTVFAPEIRGMWEFLPIPSTIREDGTQSGVSPITSVGTTPSTAVMMLSGSKHQKETWSFIKWWTSDETQTKYCNEMEAVIGVAAKQPTANKNVLASLPWTASEYKNLSAQFEHLEGTPEVPGGYYISRYFDFAFNDVYSNSEPSARALLKYIKVVNNEIARKRAEFGLDK